MQFNYKNIHKCEALVITCIDFRFWEAIVKYLKEEKEIGDFDITTFPGAAKMIVENKEGCPAKSSADVSCNLHGSKKIIIINHADCGAYGGRKAFASREEEKQKHLSDLRGAIEILRPDYKDVEISGIYVDLDDEMEELSFISV